MEAIKLLKETEFLVGELTKGGVPFPERWKYQREIARARGARDWEAYQAALAAYARAARTALNRARGVFFL
jgi:hypothetical protein